MLRAHKDNRLDGLKQPAIYVNSNVPNCDGDLTISGNEISSYANTRLVEMPQLSFNPPSPTTTDESGYFNVVAVTTTDGATVRYTIDGSRPSSSSPVMPEKGL